LQLGLLPNPKPSSVIDTIPFLTLTLSSIVLPYISSGALMKAILDRYRGEKATVADAYRFIINKGWRFLLTSIIGGIYQFIGYIACFIGLLYTFPRGAFVSEVAIIEDKYFSKAFNRSKRLGTRNTSMINLFGFLCGLAYFIVFVLILMPLTFVGRGA